MRWTMIMLVCAMLGGCAHQSRRAEVESRAREEARRNYEDNDLMHGVSEGSLSSESSLSCSALVFDPPVVGDALTPDLSRERRDPSAFVGFDQVTTTYFYLRTDDRQFIDGDGRGQYERRAISERFGVSYR